MTDKIGPDHYRYVAGADPDGVEIRCQKFVVVGETPHYYYVVSDFYGHLIHARHQPWAEQRIKRVRKRVSKDGRRRHCCPDKLLALRSFIARQQRRLGHAQMNMSVAKLSLAEAERLLEAGHMPTGSHPCGHDEYTESLVWE